MHTIGKCEVLVDAYREDIKDHQARWEPGEIIAIVAPGHDEEIPYRIDVKPTRHGNFGNLFYSACHPDCVRNI